MQQIFKILSNVYRKFTKINEYVRGLKISQ